MSFHTLNTPSFKHFLCSNQPTKPSWHVKDLANILIKFYGKFCCFQRLYILKIGIQPEHEEANSNPELQSIKGLKQNQKKEVVATLPILRGLRNFTTPANFRNPYVGATKFRMGYKIFAT